MWMIAGLASVACAIPPEDVEDGKGVQPSEEVVNLLIACLSDLRIPAENERAAQVRKLRVIGLERLRGQTDAAATGQAVAAAGETTSRGRCFP